MKKLFVVSLVILLIFLNISNLAGKNTVKANSPIEDNAFNLKINLMMRLAHIQSISACIIKNNSMVWYHGYGFSNKAFLQRPSKDTMYMIGSISKVITATALMQLYENESYDFDLDDSVSKWLPFDFKNPKYPDVNITFRMLLAHQSSIHDHDHFGTVKYLFQYHHYSYVEEILMPYGEEYHPEYWGDYPPGAGANYSNLGFTLLGYIIEMMTNQSLEQYCQDHIFKPLEMKNTSFYLDNSDKSNLATPYYWVGGLYLRIPKNDFKFYDPCGGLFTTVEDLSHFLIAHLNGGVYDNVSILDNSTLDLMHTVQYPNSSIYQDLLRFGLGWLVWPDSNDEPYQMGHGGDLICYHAKMLVRTSDNVSIIYFYNSGSLPRILPKLLNAIGEAQINNLLFEKADSLIKHH